MNYSINLDGCGPGRAHSSTRVLANCNDEDQRTKTLGSKSKTFEEDSVDEWCTQVESVTRLCRKWPPRLFQEGVLDLA